MTFFINVNQLLLMTQEINGENHLSCFNFYDLRLHCYIESFYTDEILNQNKQCDNSFTTL